MLICKTCVLPYRLKVRTDVLKMLEKCEFYKG